MKETDTKREHSIILFGKLFIVIEMRTGVVSEMMEIDEVGAPREPSTCDRNTGYVNAYAC